MRGCAPKSQPTAAMSSRFAYNAQILHNVTVECQHIKIAVECLSKFSNLAIAIVKLNATMTSQRLSIQSVGPSATVWP